MANVQKKPFINSLVEGSVDAAVYQAVLKTFARETITFLDYGNIGITQVNPKIISRVEFTETEISPFRKFEIDCSKEEPEEDCIRQASCQKFAAEKAEFRDVRQFLVNSFSPDPAGHRPYPSAGGLYPVEPLIFLFPERLNGFSEAAGCYHFRPVSQKLQRLQKIDASLFFERLMHQYFEKSHWPCFGILYTAHLSKAIFKYRYRGYRHALMEAGSMYQQAIRVSQKMGWRNTVWSTFSEHEMLCALELDYGSWLPLTMQFFGYGEQ